MPRHLDNSYLNEKGKRVAGTAAHLNYVYTVKGGVQGYNDEVGAAYIAEFIRQNTNKINTDIEIKAKRNRFKAM